MAFVPAPEPMLRRIARTRGAARTVSLRAVLSIAVERERFEAAAREAIARFDAFRLRVERPMAAPELTVTLGAPPDVRFTWGAAPLPGQTGAEAATAIANPGTDANTIDFEISGEPGASVVTFRAPAWCADRRSLEIVMDRIVATLATGGGKGSDDDVSYLDVAAWLDELQRSDDGWRGRLHWRRVVPTCTLAVDVPVAADGPAREIRITLPRSRALAQLPREFREAIAALAWLWVVRDMTKNPSLAIGCLCDGRTDEGLRAAVGVFSRFVPLIATPETRDTADVVRLAATAIAEGRDWQEMFRWDDAAASDGSAGTGEFPYAFAFRETPRFEAWRAVDSQSDAESEHSLLLLCYEDGPEETRAVFQSRHPELTRDDLAALAARWLDRVEHYLDAPLRRPVAVGRGECETLHDALARACATYGDRIAVSSKEGSLSFAAIERIASGLAALLPEVAPGSVMALHAEPSPLLIAAMHGVLKLGAACLLIPPGTGDAEATMLLTTARVTFILSDRAWPAAERARCEVLDLGSALRAIAHSAAAASKGRPVDPDHAACVRPLRASRSSSGGRLAIVRSHRSLLAAWRDSHATIRGAGQPHRVGIKHSQACDVGLAVLFPLLGGHTLVLGAGEPFEDVDLRVTTPTAEPMRLCLVPGRAANANAPLEMIVSGVIWPSGYAGAPAATAEDFVPHPSGDASRSYRAAVLAGPAEIAQPVAVARVAAAAANSDADPVASVSAATESGGAIERPRTALEARLLREWEDILDSPAVGVETSFLDAGGDSFSIAQFNLRIRRVLGLEIPLLDMFRYSNIRLLARHLDGLPRSAS